jgi:hypothetical protein
MVARGELKGVSIGYSRQDLGNPDRRRRHRHGNLARDALGIARSQPGFSSRRRERRGSRTGRATIPGTAPPPQLKRKKTCEGTCRAAPRLPPLLPRPLLRPQPRRRRNPRRRGLSAPACPAAQPAAAAPAPAATPQIARFSGADAVAFVDQGRAWASKPAPPNWCSRTKPANRRRSCPQRAAAGRRRAPAHRNGPARAAAITVTRDGDETTRNAIVGAIVARALRSDVPDASREYMGWRLLEIAASRAGIDTRRASATRSPSCAPQHHVGLPEAARGGRQQDPAGALHDRAADLSAHRGPPRPDRLQGRPSCCASATSRPCCQYQEDGEIQAGTINEGRESVILGSYGRILRLSRQAIVNDDLGAFDSVFGSIGMVVARFENTLAFTVKAQNSGGGPKLSDGVNFFHASHANLAGVGHGADVTNLGLARAAMRKQKDLDGNALNIAPSIILTGPDIETPCSRCWRRSRRSRRATSTRSPARCSTSSTPTSPATAGNSTPTRPSCRRSTTVIWPTPRARG